MNVGDNVRDIIGPGGSVIKRIQAETGARLEFVKDAPGKTCTITGTSEQARLQAYGY